MEGGVSRDCSITRTCFGKNSLKGCRGQGNLDNFVIIDVDSDGFVIDVPESLQKKLKCSNARREGKKFPLRGIICIDDDDDDAGEDVTHLGINMEGAGNLGNVGTPSKSSHAHDHDEKSVDADTGACRVVHERTCAFKLSKCKKTNNRRTSSRNHYGLYSEGEGDSSLSGISDCEVIEDSFGELREQWEKASMKRRSSSLKSPYGLEDQADLFNLHDGTTPCAESEYKVEQNSEIPFFSSSNNVSVENINSFVFNATEDGLVSCSSLNPCMERPFAISELKVDKESFPWLQKPSTQENTEYNWRNDVNFRGQTSVEDNKFPLNKHQSTNGCSINAQNGRNVSRGSSHFNQEEGYKNCHHTKSSFQDCKQDAVEVHSPNEKVSLYGQGVPLFESHHKKIVPDEKDGRSTEAPPSCNTYSNEVHNNYSGSMEKMNLDSREKCVSYVQPFEDTAVGNVVLRGRASPGEPFLNRTHVSAGCQHTNETYSPKRSSGNSQCYETVHGQGMASISAEQTDSLCAQTGDLKTSVQKDIINDREKLKETDEYKRAVEEEWVARQQQLKIQAEEAQRLRRRRKAESLRILEMEKRQKQRVDEVRESQKKDEENLNMKERLRAGIRKELCKLEGMCIDMASILRSLGIHVGGGFHPSSHEVHAAYKRALLNFHPDRQSRKDIHQQVEAEEKFKLISRMKETFLSTSCQ